MAMELPSCGAAHGRADDPPDILGREKRRNRDGAGECAKECRSVRLTPDEWTQELPPLGGRRQQLGQLVRQLVQTGRCLAPSGVRFEGGVERFTTAETGVERRGEEFRVAESITDARPVPGSW
jgi:hypothetical protein